MTSHETDTVELGALLKKAIAFIRQRRELQQKSDSRRQRRATGFRPLSIYLPECRNSIRAKWFTAVIFLKS